MAVDSSKFNHLSPSQLSELLDDDDKLGKMAQEMDEAQNVQLDKEMTLAGNRSLAEANLLYQPKLDSRKATLTQKYQELQVLMESHQLKKTKLDQQSVNASLETLLALLQAEGAKIEEETENMAENFLDGGIQMDSFVDEYLSKRKLAHLRRVKIEKLQEMVLKGQRLPQVSMQPQSRPSEVIQAPPSLYPAPFNTPPSVMPRRAVPPPPPPQPAQAGMYPTPFAMAAQQPAPGLPYAASPCPPIPSRIGYQPPGQMLQPGYPVPYTPQYPPALPQRPPQRLPPNPGFIL